MYAKTIYAPEMMQRRGYAWGDGNANVNASTRGTAASTDFDPDFDPCTKLRNCILMTSNP
jgi:hypothetical protein